MNKITDLPDLIILKSFGYLDFQQLLNLRFLERNFEKVLRYRIFHSVQELFQFTFRDKEKQQSIIKLVNKYNRYVRVTSIKGELQFNLMFNSVTDLSVTFRNRYEFDLFFAKYSQLKGVKHLAVSGLFYSQGFVHPLQEIIPNLISFKYTSFIGSVDAESFDNIYSINLKKLVIVANIGNLVDAISNSFPSLESLELYNRDELKLPLNENTEFKPFNNLKHLNLTLGLGNLDEYILNDDSKFPKLTDLEINKPQVRFVDRYLHQSWTKLKSLTTVLTNPSTDLIHLKSLSKLNLEISFQPTATFQLLLSELPNLISISIRTDFLDDEAFDYNFKALKLRRLELSGLTQLSNNSIRFMSQSLPSIQHIKFEGRKPFFEEEEDSKFDVHCLDTVGNSYFKHLITLDLVNVPNVFRDWVVNNSSLSPGVW